MSVSSEIQTLVDAFEDPRILIREDYTVAYANKAFIQRFGRSDYAGRTCHELLFHRSTRCAECGDACPLDQASVLGKPVSALRQVLTPGGVVFYDIESTPIHGVDGKPVFFLESIRDKSGTKKLLQTEGVIANSPAVKELLKKIACVVSRDTPVLFVGELGTGKEIFARLIHENSRRAAHSFLHLDCATLDEQVLNEEFSSAIDSDLAGGTLYLSDVAELSLAMQYVILKLLETGCFAPRGRASSTIADLRVLASTRHDLVELVKAGKFREDLFYRLSTCRFIVPTLRERSEDIAELSDLLLSKIAGGSQYRLTPEALDYLVSRHWHGNFYELEATLERAVIFSTEAEITLDCVKKQVGDAIEDDVEPDNVEPDTDELLAKRIRNWTGTRAELAQALGVSVRTLYRMIRKYEI